MVVMLIAFFAYDRVVTVTFVDHQPRIASLYCKFFAPDVAVLHTPVIFIPGTKGSLLASRGTVRWLTLLQLLPGGEPLRYDATADDITATDLFVRMRIIPGVVEYRPYFRIAAALACQKDTYVFTYDWRRNPADHALALEALVENIHETTGKYPSIIAHSMGGLVAHYFLKQHATMIDRVVYVGVPFGSGLNFLDDIDQGETIGWNRSILSAAALFSHPGSFALLPHPGVLRHKGDDVMEVQTWKKYHLSVYKNIATTTDEQAADAVLTSNLEQAKQFYATMDAPTPLKNSFLFVVGNCRDTLYAITPDGTRVMHPGDSRVLEEAAYPVEKEQLQKTIITTCATHDHLLSDDTILQKIFQFLE